jgi:hypothetical protein
MTETEQALTGPLLHLKSAGYAELARTLLAGVRGPVSPREEAALERLSLAPARSAGDRALRTLVLGALRRT